MTEGAEVRPPDGADAPTIVGRPIPDLGPAATEVEVPSPIGGTPPVVDPSEAERAEPQEELEEAEPQQEPERAEPQQEPERAEPQQEPEGAEPQQEPEGAEPQQEPNTEVVTEVPAPEPAAALPPPPPLPSTPPLPSPEPDSAASAGSERPEIPIAAAFVGGFLLAMILRRLARR